MSRRSLFQRIRRRFRQRIQEPVLAAVRKRRNAARAYRPVFVTGAMGSGTTLLALVLGQRFECAAVIDEGSTRMPRDRFLAVRPVASFPSIREYEDAIRPSPAWSVAEGRAQLLDLYRAHSDRAGEVVIDKQANTLLVRAEFLARCFPDACFVLIFRDPVANLEGFRRKWSTFGADSLAENIRFYRETHERFLAAMPSLGSRVLVVEYEELVKRSEEVLDAVGRRLSLPPATRSLRLESRPNAPGKGIRHVAGNRIEIVTDANALSYRELAAEAQEEIRSVLGPLHARLRAAARELLA